MGYRLVDPRRTKWAGRRETFTVIALFVFALAVRAGFRLYTGGFRTGADTGQYTRTCDALGQGLLNGVDGIVGIQYYGFVLPYCSVYNVGDYVLWGYSQLFLSALTAVLVYAIAKRIRDMKTGVVAALIFAVLVDSVRWSVEIMSETFFIFVIVLVLWRALVARDHPSKPNLLILFLVTAWLAVTRPFGLPLIVVGAGLYGVTRYSHMIPNRFRVPAYVLLLLGSATMFVVGSVVFYPSVLTHMWDQGFVFWRGEARPGVPLPGQIDSQSVLPGYPTLVQVAAFGVLLLSTKVVAFFIPTQYFWDPSHTVFFVFSLAYLPTLLFSAGGVYALLKDNRETLALLGAPILTMILITMLLFVERRFRYRTPLAPSLAILAAVYLTPKLTALGRPDSDWLVRLRRHL
jgi:4-amino-4-deoxy-L-arabinose transferase-like glycosyltransferase